MPIITQRNDCQGCCSGYGAGVCIQCHNREASIWRYTASGFTNGSAACSQFNGTRQLAYDILTCAYTQFGCCYTFIGGGISVQLDLPVAIPGTQPTTAIFFSHLMGADASYGANILSDGDCLGSTPLILPRIGAASCGASPATVQLDAVQIRGACTSINEPDTLRFTLVDPTHHSCLDGLTTLATWQALGSGAANAWFGNPINSGTCFLCPPIEFNTINLYLSVNRLGHGEWDFDTDASFGNAYQPSMVVCDPLTLIFPNVVFCNGDRLNAVVTLP